MKHLDLFIPLTKVDVARRLVYGVVTAEAPDRGQEICDYASTKPYYQKWSQEINKASGGKSLGNLRAMHGKIAAGRLEVIHFDDDAKQIEICAKVVDDAEWAKVEAGVYTGFSQGGGYVKRWPDDADPKLTRYTANPSEISLVDYPCLPDATFTMVKVDGFVERRRFPQHEAAAFVEQVWRTQDGRTFKKKAEALAHQSAFVNAGAAFDALAKIETGLDHRGVNSAKAEALSRLRKSLEQDAFDAARALEAMVIVFDVLRSEITEDEPDESQIAALDTALARLKEFVLSELGVKADAAARPGAPVRLADALAATTAERDAHKAALDALTPRLEKLAARIEDIARQPLPPPALAGARPAERSAAREEDLVTTLAALSGEERATLLIKVAQSQPIPFR